MPKLARFIPSLPTLDLTGALDILLVAFVVYEALMVVRGTRAGPVAPAGARGKSAPRR